MGSALEGVPRFLNINYEIYNLAMKRKNLKFEMILKITKYFLSK